MEPDPQSNPDQKHSEHDGPNKVEGVLATEEGQI